jgi:hypothetical protein
MKNRYYAIIGVLFCVIVAISGCTIPWTGSGTNGNNPPDVQGVTAASLTGPGTIIIEQGNNESIKVEGSDSDKSNLEIIKTGPSLEIISKASADVKIYLTVKNITALTISGPGIINATGKVEQLAITITGQGTVNAKDLVAQNAVVTVTGEGEALVNAVQTLVATVTGSGSIKYQGNPQVQQTVTGGGSVSKA